MAKFKFRLMFGSHMQEELLAGSKDTQTVIYRPGEIIDTDKDLATRFNSPDPLHGKKYERVDYADYKAKEALAWMKANQPEAYANYIKHMEAIGQDPVSGTPTKDVQRAPAGAPRNDSLVEDLQGYTLRELQAYAESEEIDLEGATKKDEVLGKIMEYVAASSPA